MITLLAHSITITPGTVRIKSNTQFVENIPNKTVIVVHSIFGEDINSPLKKIEELFNYKKNIPIMKSAQELKQN